MSAAVGRMFPALGVCTYQGVAAYRPVGSPAAVFLVGVSRVVVCHRQPV